MKITTGTFIAVFLLTAIGRGEDEKLAQHPAAIQFREHLLHADVNKDGFVTRGELVSEINNFSKRDPEEVKAIVDSMFGTSDLDHNGRISVQEIKVGAKVTALRSIVKHDMKRAEAIMQGIAEFKITHNGSIPKSFDDLVKAHLIEEKEAVCILADGTEKPWVFNPTSPKADDYSVMFFSPAPVDEKGQYIVGLVNGRVLGVHDKTLTPEIIKGMHVHP